jgi:hypothetical protein
MFNVPSSSSSFGMNQQPASGIGASGSQFQTGRLRQAMLDADHAEDDQSETPAASVSAGEPWNDDGETRCSCQQWRGRVQLDS